MRTWTATIGGGEVVEVPSDGEPRRIRVIGPVTPFFPPSIAMFHEVVRRAHRRRRGRTEVLVYAMASNAEPHTYTVEWPAADTAAVRYRDGPPMLYAVDPRGRLLGTRSRDGGRCVIRLR